MYPTTYFYLNLHTHTYTEVLKDMSTKTISITEEAYECLRSLKTSENDSFSKIILKHFPKKKTLSELFSDLDPDNEFADAIEAVIEESRAKSPNEIRL